MSNLKIGQKVFFVVRNTQWCDIEKRNVLDNKVETGMVISIGDDIAIITYNQPSNGGRMGSRICIDKVYFYNIFATLQEAEWAARV